ncbi:hypothetical protein PUN28_016640 [Cardiocondyla obscurior]
MELYKQIPVNTYTESYCYDELCSNCAQNKNALRNIAMYKKKKKYEKHCPFCHCPVYRQRFVSPSRLRTSGNVEAMINRCEHVFAGPVSSAIKKSQSSPLSQKLCMHDCQTDVHPCYLRKLQNRRHRRLEHDKYLYKMKEGNIVNSELPSEEDIAAYSAKKFLKKHNRHSQPELRSPDEQEGSESEEYTPQVFQPRKLRVPDSRSRRHYIGMGDGEYVAKMKNESDVETQERRKLVSDDLERLKQSDAEVTITLNEDDKRLLTRKLDVTRAAKSRKPTNSSRCTASKSSEKIDQSIIGPSRELTPNGPDLTKLDLDMTKTHLYESIGHILMITDKKTKNDASVQQEQTEQESFEKMTHDLENNWQLLFNDLRIHQNSMDVDRRIVRLECLNHIRQELNKLYALESTLTNCTPKLQSLSSRNMPCNEESQQSQRQLEQKTTNS